MTHSTYDRSMTDRELATAHRFNHLLPGNAAVNSSFFFGMRAWNRFTNEEKRELGYDFARRVGRDEFPNLRAIPHTSPRRYCRA